MNEKFIDKNSLPKKETNFMKKIVTDINNNPTSSE